MRKIIGLLFILLLLVSCSAGSNNAGGTGANNSNGFGIGSMLKEFSFADLEWEMYNGLMDGGRYMLIDLKNNSEYIIKEIEFRFTEKEGLSEEERNKFYDYIAELFSLDKSEVEEYKGKKFWITARNAQIIMPHTEEDFNCYYFSGSYYFRNEELVDLIEPDYVEMKYADAEKIYKAYYDLRAEKLKVDKDTEDTQQWSSYEFANIIPKPIAPIVENVMDYDHVFECRVYGFNEDEMNDYMEKCKELGFTFDNGTYIHRAVNENGDELSVSYSDYGGYVEIEIRPN